MSEIRQKMRPVLVLDRQKRLIGRRSVDITGLGTRMRGYHEKKAKIVGMIASDSFLGQS